MGVLQSILLEETRRSQVITDCAQLVENEVAAKTGLSGIAVKGAFAIVKAVKPGIIRDAVDRLVDDFVLQLEPFYENFAAEKQHTGEWERFLRGRSGEVAQALLGVTDKRAAQAAHGNIRKAYGKLRPSGVKHVEAAVPAIARLVGKYLPASA